MKRTIAYEGIVQLDLKGNYINEFKTMAEACSKLGIGPERIFNNVIGKTIRCKKFIFRYKEYYNPNRNYSYKHLKFIKNVKKKIQEESYMH